MESTKKFKIEAINCLEDFAEYFINIEEYQNDFNKSNYDEWMNKVEQTIIKLRKNIDASYFNGIEFTTNEKIRLYRTTNTPCFKYGQSWALDPESLDWAGGEIGKNIYYIDIEPTDVYAAFNNYLDCIIEVIVPNVKKKYKVHKLKINDQIKVLPYECNRVVRE